MSFQMKIINTVLKYTVKPILTYAPFHKDAIWIARTTLNVMTHIAIRPIAMVTKVKISDKLRGEWVERQIRVDKANTRVCLYLHGGGYIACSPSSHRTITSYIAMRGNCSVLAINYRKAPECQYPCAFEDALMSYKYLLWCGYRPENIVIAGDSAGGNLALVTTRAIIDAGLPRPAAVVGLSPWCDLAGESDSITTMNDADPMLPGERIREAGMIYAGRVDLDDPLISPRWQSFKDFPPTMFVYGELEVLRDEIRDTFKKMQSETDSECVIKEELGCPHVFQLFVGIAPESKDSLREICDFFEKHWNVQKD